MEAFIAVEISFNVADPIAAVVHCHLASITENEMSIFIDITIEARHTNLGIEDEETGQ